MLNYINELVSQHEIVDHEKTLGLYIVGRPDPEIRQLENAIIAEKKTHQLRIISVNWLLTLAEMMNEYEVAHDDVLALIRPSTPSIDPVIELMTRIVDGSIERSQTTGTSSVAEPRGAPRSLQLPARMILSTG